MRNPIYAIALFVACLFSGCSADNTDVVVYKINEPVYMPVNEFRTKASVSAPVEISQQGKMCLYKGFLYISEPAKGIHIIDNRNPSAPKNDGFIELMGNVDLAIRNDMLYADSYTDLVWFELKNPLKPEFAGRMDDAFPYVLPETCNQYGTDVGYEYYCGDRSKGIIVGWHVATRIEKVDKYREMYSDAANNVSPSFSVSGGGSGINGSMARFCLYKNYMYSVLNNRLFIFDISGSEPVKVDKNDVYIGYNVETVFNYKNNLFMGTPTGLLIYNIDNPVEPVFCSFTGHVWGCDPVVVEDDIAYVTVRTGNMCGQNFNELIVLDISDVYNTKPIVTYTMTNPKGLGIDDGTLFVCDNGLKIFNAENPQTIMANQLAHYKGMDGYDVIPYSDILIMIASDGIYQYNYKDAKNIKQISKIAISNNN